MCTVGWVRLLDDRNRGTLVAEESDDRLLRVRVDDFGFVHIRTHPHFLFGRLGATSLIWPRLQLAERRIDPVRQCFDLSAERVVLRIDIVPDHCLRLQVADDDAWRHLAMQGLRAPRLGGLTEITLLRLHEAHWLLRQSHLANIHDGVFEVAALVLVADRGWPVRDLQELRLVFSERAKCQRLQLRQLRLVGDVLLHHLFRRHRLRHIPLVVEAGGLRRRRADVDCSVQRLLELGGRAHVERQLLVHGPLTLLLT